MAKSISRTRSKIIDVDLRPQNYKLENKTPFKSDQRIINSFLRDIGTPVFTAKILNAEDGLQGYYDPKTNEIIISDKARNVNATVLHELGHGHDAANNPINYGLTGKLRSAKKAFASIPKAEKEYVWINRFNRMVSPSERVQTFAAVQRRLTDASYFRYFTSPEETFADAFAQGGGNVGSFLKNAPTFSKFFRVLSLP